MMSERQQDHVRFDTRVHLPKGWACDRQEESTLWFKGQMLRDGLAALHRSLQENLADRTKIEHIAERLTT
jgi:hypothetical protein